MGILGSFTTGIARICEYGVFQRWDGDTALAGGVATRFSCEDATKILLFGFWEGEGCYLNDFASVVICRRYFWCLQVVGHSMLFIWGDFASNIATFLLLFGFLRRGWYMRATLLVLWLFWGYFSGCCCFFRIFLAFSWCRRIKSAAIPISIALEAATFACLSVLIKGICYLILFQHKCCY